MSSAPDPAYDPAQDPAFELLGLLAEEFVAGDVPATALPGDGQVPAQLVVPLEDEAGRSSTVHVCFLPDFAAPAVLQYMVVLPYEVLPTAVPDTARLLHLVNSALPLTGFELGESVATVVFRHVHAVSVHPLDPGVVAWTLSMIHHAVSRFDDVVRLAAEGASYAALVSAHGRALADLYADDADDAAGTGSG